MRGVMTYDFVQVFEEIQTASHANSDDERWRCRAFLYV